MKEPLPQVTAPTQDFVRRVAIDWGSGSVRVLLADVNPLNGRVVPLYSMTAPLALAEDLNASEAAGKGAIFSEEMMERALGTFAELKKTFTPYAPTAYRGIGTAAFRKAPNGDALLKRLHDKLGIKIALMPQQDEAAIGFLSAMTAYDGDASDLIVWDCGNGSFQLVARSEKGFNDYGAEIGNLGATTALIHEVQGKSDGVKTPNPISMDEARALVPVLKSKMPSVPQWLKAKLSNDKSRIAGLGGAHSIFNAYPLIEGGEASEYSKELLWNAIARLTNKTDAEISEEFPALPKPHKALGKLVLLYATMDKLGIEKIDFNYRLVGSTRGIATYPPLWE